MSYRINLFLQDRQNDYQASLQTDCEQATRRLAVSVVTYSADRDADTQIRQIREALAAPLALRPRAILVSPVSELSIMPLAHDAARLGIAWVMLSRWSDSINDFRRRYPSVPIFAVLPDHQEIGRIQGLQLRRLLSLRDEVVYIQGPIVTHSTRLRRVGLDKELADRIDIRWSRFNGDWSQASGESAMKSWLMTFTGMTLPEFVILAQNDSMAMGARQALLDWCVRNGKRLKSGVRVVGCDGSPSYGQRLVQSKELSATVTIPPIAGYAVTEVVRALKTGSQPAAEIRISVRSYPDMAALARSSVE